MNLPPWASFLHLWNDRIGSYYLYVPWALSVPFCTNFMLIFLGWPKRSFKCLLDHPYKCNSSILCTGLGVYIGENIWGYRVSKFSSLNFILCKWLSGLMLTFLILNIIFQYTPLGGFSSTSFGFVAAT